VARGNCLAVKARNFLGRLSEEMSAHARFPESLGVEWLALIEGDHAGKRSLLAKIASQED